jgi:peptidoglycan/LPS O-acetylase OafA/YrhL
LSIALVLFAHTSGTRFFPSFVLARRDLGNLGDRVFFVISGFLITTLLLDELETTGTISLRWFYLRRALRIFPAAYTYIAVMFVAASLGWIALNSGDFLHAITYTVNYQFNRPWHTIHLWSLSVEEQFYMLWPAVLLLTGKRLGLRIAAAVIVIAPILRVVTYYLIPPLSWTVGTSFQTNADALACGCVLAGITTWLGSQPGYLKMVTSKWFTLAPVLIFTASFLQTKLAFSLPIGDSFMNIAIAICIDRSVRFESDAVGRVLNWKPLVFIGVLSYSIYLWQEPFLNRLGTSSVNWFPVNLICVATAAYISYRWVEKPCLNLRKRIERSWRQPAAVLVPPR